jgi:thiol-disulfide isomerase/thioredoxin
MTVYYDVVNQLNIWRCMNKKSLSLMVLIIVLAGASIAVLKNKSTTKSSTAVATSGVALQSTIDVQACPKPNDSTTAVQGISPGSYVTYADYKKDCAKYSNAKIVYFFHATWCPTCQGIEKEINADMARIPAGVTIVKTDYDTEKDLKAKYGVTVQTTFVQIDRDGNKIAKYTAANLADAVAGIK